MVVRRAAGVRQGLMGMYHYRESRNGMRVGTHRLKWRVGHENTEPLSGLHHRIQEQKSSPGHPSAGQSLHQLETDLIER